MRTRTADGSLDELVELQLRRSDLRYTDGRRSIVDRLAGLEHPVGFAELLAGLPDVPRSSAYRHLLVLEGAGVVRRITATDGHARFELAEAFTEHHHHLLCTSCGRVFDVTPTAAFERSTARAVAELAGRFGFRPVSHSPDVVGHCADCT
jgi:Fur family ferric uptake transcriptional regulator